MDQDFKLTSASKIKSVISPLHSCIVYTVCIWLTAHRSLIHYISNVFPSEARKGWGLWFRTGSRWLSLCLVTEEASCTHDYTSWEAWRTHTLSTTVRLIHTLPTVSMIWRSSTITKVTLCMCVFQSECNVSGIFLE